MALARPDKRAALSLEASWWVLAITLQRLRPGVRSQWAGFQAPQLALPCKGNACIPKVIIRTRQSAACESRRRRARRPLTCRGRV